MTAIIETHKCYTHMTLWQGKRDDPEGDLERLTNIVRSYSVDPDSIITPESLQKQVNFDIGIVVRLDKDGPIEIKTTRFYLRNIHDNQKQLSMRCAVGAYDDYDVYRYIDRRMTLLDIVGSKIARLNEDSSGWLFFHAPVEFHHGHEVYLENSVSTAFDAEVQRADKAALDAVYDCLIQNDNGNQRAVFYYSRSSDDLKTFREQVKEAIVDEARTRHIGHYHQNPDDAHIHGPLERAIRSVMAEWRKTNETGPLDRWTPIKSYVEAVLAEVVKLHEYETRWDKEARLAAEAKAASEVAETPGC